MALGLDTSGLKEKVIDAPGRAISNAKTRAKSFLFGKTLWFGITLGLSLGFVLGTRLYEVGGIKFQGYMKGSNVFVTGSCLLSGSKKRLNMAEDQIKLTIVNQTSVSGLIRSSREIVECDLDKVVIESMPLLSVLLYPSRIEPVDVAKLNFDTDDYSGIVHKTLVVTGACQTKDGKDLAPFTNEDVEVLKTEKRGELSLISGIRLSDKALVNCMSDSISYKQKVYEAPVKKEVKDYVGQYKLVTSRCLADKPQEAGGLLVDLSKTKVLVTSNIFDQNNKIVKFSGDAMLENSKKQKMVVKINCDASKFPTLIDDFNQKTDTLVPSTDSDLPSGSES